MKQRAGDGNQRTQRARGEHVEDPGGPKQQIGLPIAGFFLQRAKEREQDFADFQDANIHGFFQPLRDGVETDKLGRKQRTEQVPVRLPRNQAATLCRQLPSSQIDEIAERTVDETRDAPAIRR